jgi:hypothetical protein
MNDLRSTRRRRAETGRVASVDIRASRVPVQLSGPGEAAANASLAGSTGSNGECHAPFAAFAKASASLSKCLSAAAVRSICLRRASSVSLSVSQPFSRIDVMRV